MRGKQVGSADEQPGTVADDVQQGGGRPTIDALMIELATAAHVPYLRRLKAQVMEGRYRPVSSEDELARWREVYCTNEYFHRLIEDPDAMLLSIGSLREPVGMVVLHRRDDHVEIDDLLCLNPRQGDGRRLIEACLGYAEVWGIRDVVCDIYPGHENAVRFLERHGFVLAGDSSNDLGHPMMRYTRSIG